MVLELSEQQLRDLDEVLAAALRELYDEVARTDHRPYRDALRARLERLEAVSRQVQGLLARSDAYA
jgi:hypothetical protein